MSYRVHSPNGGWYVEGGLYLSRRERKRLKVLEEVKRHHLCLAEAATILRMSYRQVGRIWLRYQEAGDRGLVHQGRGKAPNNAIDAGLKERILARYRERYEGFGPTLAAEKLAEEGMVVDHNTLWRWLREAGLWARHRARSPYRQRRERKRHFGEMVQLDGSFHCWFEDRGEKSCLMNLVDDATGTTLSLMSKEETTEAAMRVLWAWVRRYGIPASLYCDRRSVYITEREPTLEEQLAGVDPMTAFGLACKKLGIEIITAHSPQAKGRVERNHGVYQDRFVKELRLRGMGSIEEANVMLAGGFFEGLNRRFAKKAASEADCHVPIGTTDLRSVFCYEVQRSVARDWVVQNDCRRYQIRRDARPRPRPGSKVTVAQWLDESIHLLVKGKEIPFVELDPVAGREEVLAS
jgi:transposase